MGWFRKKKSKSKSVSQSYRESKGFQSKKKYWDNHINDAHYDPTLDFRIVKKPVKKKRRLWGKKKKREDEYQKGRDRVKRIINK